MPILHEPSGEEELSFALPILNCAINVSILRHVRELIQIVYSAAESFTPAISRSLVSYFQRKMIEKPLLSKIVTLDFIATDSFDAFVNVHLMN